ncbi:putative Wd-repeat protein [Tritrichomonas foetus]|uniref:Wd-repeat protein n=1 Tax=Tritrichomonas foetus TaxID=1144522 RepID=A0A1J4J7Y9_9EUKA|nr:putative Wd-repeat protein [Tritrichomonas foetus]|eukprot:OHS93541.1 putative Wd-repeat protein [Tritrichomonas foetus]
MSNSFKISPSWATEESEGDIFGIQYSNDNSFIGCALSNGQVSLYSGSTGRLSYTLEQSPDHFPVTSLKFHPSSKSFVSVSVDGSVKCWSTRKASVEWEFIEDKNQLFVVSINPNGESFVTAGLDTKIRLYDFESHKISRALERYQIFDSEAVPGHTNRIFSAIFNPKDSNILYSGGWDDTIQIWDLRVNRSVRSLFGAHICSDSLDIHDNMLAAGSWRTTEQLQLWDLRTFRNETTFKWKDQKQCLVYATKFHPNGEFLFAAGSGANEIATFSVKTGNQVGDSIEFDSPIFSIALSKNGNELIAGTEKGKIHSFKIE